MLSFGFRIFFGIGGFVIGLGQISFFSLYKFALSDSVAYLGKYSVKSFT